MLTQPKQEWDAVSAEFSNVPAIFRGYVIPVSLLGPVAALVGTVLFGERGTLFGMVETPIGAAVQDAVAHYLLGLASVWVLAVALDLLTPSFGGSANRVQAFKIAAYGSTPAWVCGILGLVPRLAPYGLIGVVWTLVLVARGAPTLMKVQPRERANAFGLVAAVATAIVGLIFEGLARAFG